MLPFGVKEIISDIHRKRKEVEDCEKRIEILNQEIEKHISDFQTMCAGLVVPHLFDDCDSIRIVPIDEVPHWMVTGSFTPSSFFEYYHDICHVSDNGVTIYSTDVDETRRKIHHITARQYFRSVDLLIVNRKSIKDRYGLYIDSKI